MRNFTQTTALFKRVSLCIMLLAFQPVYAESIEANSFTNEKHQQRYSSLVDELFYHATNEILDGGTVLCMDTGCEPEKTKIPE